MAKLRETVGNQAVVLGKQAGAQLRGLPAGQVRMNSVKNAESLLNASGNGSKRFVVRIISATLLNVLPSNAMEASELTESVPLAKLPFAM